MWPQENFKLLTGFRDISTVQLCSRLDYPQVPHATEEKNSQIQNEGHSAGQMSPFL